MRIKKTPALIIIVLTALVFLCAPREEVIEKKPVPAKKAKRWIEYNLESLSLKEKIGQMVLVRCGGYFVNETSRDFKRSVINQVVKNGVGGVLVHRGNTFSLAHTTNKIQSLVSIPVLISADLERGAGQKTDRLYSFPSNMAIGATGNEEYAYFQGKLTAIEGRALGIHQTYAPVMDVNINPDNPIINVRSYGEDPGLVAKLGSAFIRGCQDYGMIATAKHFPGHGDTDTDSHSGLPVIKGDIERIMNVELKPFKTAINAGVKSIMTAHISVPALDTSGVPATLSPVIITGLLRDRFNFKGMLVSDAMEMGGIVNQYTIAEAAIRAINAGIDMILIPPDTELAIEAVYRAVLDGRIEEATIDRATRKILEMKTWLGLHENKYVDYEKIFAKISLPENNAKIEKIAENAVTLVKNDNNLIPVNPESYKKILYITLTGEESYGLETIMKSSLRQRTTKVTFRTIDSRTNNEEFQETVETAQSSDLIICGTFIGVSAWRGTVNLDEKNTEYLKNLLSLEKPFILISFGNPYILRQFPEIDAYFACYGRETVMQSAVIKAIFGESDISGKLPISISEEFPSGTGVEIKKSRSITGDLLWPSTPFSAGLSPHLPDTLRNIMETAISDTAFPGGTLLVARNAKIAFCEGFGRYTYDNDSPAVTRETLYDLASVTKTIITTTLTMILCDEKRLNLEAPVSRYLPDYRYGNKMKVMHLLTHTSGLPAWLELFEKAQSRDELIEYAKRTPLVYKTGEESVYSDLGIILLGAIIEKITGIRLDKLAEEKIFTPLKMNNTMFNPPGELKEKIAPTERDASWRRRLVWGTVHDENADVMDGVAPHAGLFSNVRDLAVFCQMMLNGGVYNGIRIVNESTVQMFIQRQNLVKNSSRAIGWDTPSEPSSSGFYFSDNSYGHTGFTGTSIWVDHSRQLFVILLTNRVYPTRENNKIRDIRPRIHNAVMLSIMR